MIALADLLEGATARVWPRRAQQEALFDLPERKAWTAEERAAVIDGCARWLVENGVVVHPEVAARPVKRLSIFDVRARLASVVERGAQVSAVAHDLQRLAPLVGATPKTLANTLGRFAQQRRPDHRWLLALARLVDGPPPVGLCFEDRSQAAVMGLLTRAASHAGVDQLDAVDALVLFSLLSLWQRRRPTVNARGNRARASTRRSAPKPAVRLIDSLIQPEQALALLDIPRPGVRALAIEAALTRAHLVPHVDRRGAQPDPPRLLPSIARSVTGATPRDAIVRFRIGVMRAWRAGEPWPDVPHALADHPYVVMTTALARQARGGRLSEAALADRWGRDWASKAMLAPIIRHRMHRRG